MGRIPAGQEKPDLILGTRMEPGRDQTHFCMPTAVAVSQTTGDFFVADGYCNSRVMKFNKDGKLLKIINGNWQVPHSLALFEETDVLCVANRDDTGKRVVVYDQSIIGRPYAIAAKGTALLVLRGSPGARGLTIDTAAEPGDNPVIDEWGKNDGIVSPHDLAISQNGDTVYLAEVPLNKNSVKIHKYDVINNSPADQGLF